MECKKQGEWVAPDCVRYPDLIGIILRIQWIYSRYSYHILVVKFLLTTPALFDVVFELISYGFLVAFSCEIRVPVVRLSGFGAVVKRSNTPVCKTGIRRFKSDSRLKINCSIIHLFGFRVVGSAVERVPDKNEVNGSTPLRPTLTKYSQSSRL